MPPFLIAVAWSVVAWLLLTPKKTPVTFVPTDTPMVTNAAPSAPKTEARYAPLAPVEAPLTSVVKTAKAAESVMVLRQAELNELAQKQKYRQEQQAAEARKAAYESATAVNSKPANSMGGNWK